MWWLERPDGRQVDLTVEGVSRNGLIETWLRNPSNTADLNRSVLKKQVRGSASGLARDDRVRRRFGERVVAAARSDVERPLHDADVLEGLAGLIRDLAGLLARYSVATGRLIFERHMCPEGLPSAVRRSFENWMRDTLPTAVRDELLARGADLDVDALVEGSPDDGLISAVRQRVADRVMDFAVTERSGDSREILIALALDMDADAEARIDPREVVPEAEQGRLRNLLDEAQRDVGRGPLWTDLSRFDGEEILQEAALRTHRAALKISASGTRVERLPGLLYTNISRAQKDFVKRSRLRARWELPADLTAPDAPARTASGPPGFLSGSVDEDSIGLRSAELRAVLAGIARRLEDVGSWEARCAAVILRNPATEEIQIAVTDVASWLADRVEGWPPRTHLHVTTDGPAAAAAEVVRLLQGAILEDPDIRALTRVAEGEPL